MKYNFFNEPRPETQEEIETCLENVGFGADQVYAQMEHEPRVNHPEAVNMTGWTATVVDSDEGEELFTTNGFEEEATLVEILSNVGIEIVAI